IHQINKQQAKLTPSDSALKVVSPLPMPFDRTVTWRQFAHQSIEMRVSVSENLRIGRWIGFLFLQNQKIERWGGTMLRLPLPRARFPNGRESPCAARRWQNAADRAQRRTTSAPSRRTPRVRLDAQSQ